MFVWEIKKKSRTLDAPPLKREGGGGVSYQTFSKKGRFRFF